MSAISVVVPVYKVEPYLRQCVDSILAQTFTDFELILVDDGSPDNCGAICDEYAERDSRIHVIHQENGGLSAARNAGIDWAFANSDSKWLTFIDSDDIIAIDYLECMIRIARSFHAEISACQMMEFSQDSSVDFNNEINDDINCFSGRNAALNQYEEHSLIGVSACCKVYKKELFSKIRFPIGSIHEDQAVTPIVLYSSNNVVITNQRLYGYRLRDESIMHSKFSAKRYDDIKGIDQCISFFHNNNEIELEAAAQKRKMMIIAIYSLQARKEKATQKVPKQFRLSERRALRWLSENCSDDFYTYQLAKFHPSWLRPHAYLRKIKKILHIPCN